MIRKPQDTIDAEPDMIEFEVAPISLNGKLNYRVFALSNEEEIHCDMIDIGRSRCRKQFIDELISRGNSKGVAVDGDKCERTLLSFARQNSQSAEFLDQASPKQPLDHKKILKAFRIEVLGEGDDQVILAWCSATKKRFVIKNPGRWNAQEIRQATGKQGDQRLWTADAEPPEGCYTTAELQRAVALEAAEKPRLDAQHVIGQGVWLRGDDLLVVNGAIAHVFRNGKILIREHPKYDHEILDLKEGKEWCSKESRVLANSMTRKKAKQILHETETLLRQWNWRHGWDHRITALLIIATFIQSCWSWRPLVCILGASDSGKSTLFGELISKLFGHWVIIGDRSSEAGLRQAIGHDAAPVMMDEFDKYKQRQQVLELFRTGSRGGKVYKGTADQTGRSFSIRHIGWFAAIESGDLWGQDRNRFIKLELDRPKNRGELTLPSRDDLAELSQKLLAVALWAARSSVPLAVKIRATKIKNVDGRLVESFSVVAALDAVINSGVENQEQRAVKALNAFLRKRDTVEDQGMPDEARLLQDILSATIRVSVRESGETISGTRTIGQLLTSGPICKHRSENVAPGGAKT